MKIVMKNSLYLLIIIGASFGGCFASEKGCAQPFVHTPMDEWTKALDVLNCNITLLKTDINDQQDEHAKMAEHMNATFHTQTNNIVVLQEKQRAGAETIGQLKSAIYNILPIQKDLQETKTLHAMHIQRLQEQLSQQQTQITQLSITLNAIVAQQSTNTPAVVVNNNGSAAATTTNNNEVKIEGSGDFYGTFINLRTLIAMIFVLAAFAKEGPGKAVLVTGLLGGGLCVGSYLFVENFRRKFFIIAGGTVVAASASVIAATARDKDLVAAAITVIPISIVATALFSMFG